MTIRKSVYQIIEADEKFSVLLKILDKTAFGKTMQDEDNPFTFFAPTDGAFYQMFHKTGQLQPPDFGKIMIDEILGQHIVPGVCLYTDDLRRRNSIDNLEGKRLLISQDDHRIFINDAQIVTPAATATNGVVFAIDKVLLDKDALA